MKVVSVYELRGLSRREALERLREVDWVLDEGGMFVPAEEFSRKLETLQNSASVRKRPKHKVRVVGA